ncbi:DNA-processing protein DprA [Trichococcus shcherbakoviae]|nr:DNA-processing protein DprA [Trichococcus shcherbakoviae]
MDDLTSGMIALLSFSGIGPKAVLSYFEENIGNDNKLYFHNLDKSNVKMIKKAIDAEVLTSTSWNDAIQKAKKIIEDSSEKGIRIINSYEDQYPQNFKRLPNRPILIYAKGNIELLNQDKSVAIIGTRDPSNFGKKMGYKISMLLAAKGYSIVSGLAKGVDTEAHQGALSVLGKTVAILAHGLDMPVYPKENRKLAEKILESGGLLLSTYSNGTKLFPQYLAARDEWQSGLSDGVIVIETGIKGGTNITVGHAIKQKKPIAVLDHRQFKDGELAEIKQFQGNVKYILENKADPIYTEHSIAIFDKKICNSKIKEETKEDVQKINVSSVYAQEELFE